MTGSFTHALGRIGRWPRILAAATCLLLALGSAARAAHPREAAAGSAAAVVVAARTIAAGQRLSAGDLTLESWPTRLRPNGAASTVSALVGRRVSGPLAVGDAVTSTRLLGAALTDGLAPGLAAVPVSLADPHVADLVHAGDRIDLTSVPDPDGLDDTATTDEPVTTVAHSALVLAVLRGSGDEGAELVLAADHDTAVQIAQQGGGGNFTASLVAP